METTERMLRAAHEKKADGRHAFPLGFCYNFEISSYRGAAGSIDYKTDGTIQQVSIQAK